MKQKKLSLFIGFFLAIICEVFIFSIVYFNTWKILPIYDPNLAPWFSAGFNLLSAILLFIAVLYAKKKYLKHHKIFIHLALLASALFLINYCAYHLSSSPVVFKTASLRPLYLVLLFSHLISSIICLPLIFISYGFGIFNILPEHPKLARITFYFWEYVSISGILIVIFIKFFRSY